MNMICGMPIPRKKTTDPLKGRVIIKKAQLLSYRIKNIADAFSDVKEDVTRLHYETDRELLSEDIFSDHAQVDGDTIDFLDDLNTALTRADENLQDAVEFIDNFEHWKPPIGKAPNFGSVDREGNL